MTVSSCGCKECSSGLTKRKQHWVQDSLESWKVWGRAGEGPPPTPHLPSSPRPALPLGQGPTLSLPCSSLAVSVLPWAACHSCLLSGSFQWSLHMAPAWVNFPTCRPDSSSQSKITQWLLTSHREAIETCYPRSSGFLPTKPPLPLFLFIDSLPLPTIHISAQPLSSLKSSRPTSPLLL